MAVNQVTDKCCPISVPAVKIPACKYYRARSVQASVLFHTDGDVRIRTARKIAVKIGINYKEHEVTDIAYRVDAVTRSKKRAMEFCQEITGR
jgi:hypothetical protein